MNPSKKPNSTKPNLFIEIQDYNDQPQPERQTPHRNEVAIKPLRSAKNLHELKKFNFEQENNEQCNTGRQLKRLKKLEEEKLNLMQSLEILKVSAVSAIAEKEDEIEKLREREHYGEEEEDDFYERELERGKRIRLELQEQRQQLHREMHLQRKRYISELEQKEYLIESLYEEIQEVRRELSILEDYNHVKNKKIKLLQEENSRLSDALELSTITTTVREKTEPIIDLDQTIKAQPVLSVASSIPNRSYVSYFESEHLFQSQADKSYLTQKLEELDRAHKEELIDLKNFYQKRIQGLRQIYERQLNLQTEESQRGDQRSRRHSQSSTPAIQKNSSKKQLELNLKDMYSIEESVQNQLQTSRSRMLNLRSEIKMQNLSECPSLQPRVYGNNDDTESQFTTKYFDIPTRFMLKRNKSSDTFNTIQEQEQDSKTIIKSSKIIENNVQNQAVKEEKSSLLKKSCIFAAGLISGATLTSVIGYFLKKN